MSRYSRRVTTALTFGVQSGAGGALAGSGAGVDSLLGAKQGLGEFFERIDRWVCQRWRSESVGEVRA